MREGGIKERRKKAREREKSQKSERREAKGKMEERGEEEKEKIGVREERGKGRREKGEVERKKMGEIYWRIPPHPHPAHMPPPIFLHYSLEHLCMRTKLRGTVTICQRQTLFFCSS